MSTTGISQTISSHEKYTIGILCCINLCNFIDRFCIAGVLLDVQLYFEVDDDVAGLIQTAFHVGYTLIAPLFGYYGDRYTRKYIMISTLACWIVMGMACSCVSDFTLFVITRVFVGFGESGFTILAPSMLADMVTPSTRSAVFALFYFALPVGTGLGFILTAKVNQLTGGQWWWGLRLTPVLNTLFTIMLCFGLDPKRGEKEAALLGGNPARATSYIEDLRYFLANKSFILLTAGFTCVCFLMASLGWWVPKSLSYGVLLIEGLDGTDDGVVISQLGVISIITGLLGVSIGSGFSKWLRPKIPNVDPIILTIAMILSFPCRIGALHYTPIDLRIALTYIFFGTMILNVNWAVVMDVLMYINVPTRRASAKAIETFITHILGDSVSISLVGIISEAIQDNNDFTSWTSQPPDNETGVDYGAIAQNFYGLQYALYSILIVFLIGAFFFFLLIFFVVEDKEKAVAASIEH